MLSSAGDREAAVALLDEVEAALRAADKHAGADWLVLAEARHAAVGDEVAVARCVQVAESMAVDPWDYGAVARSRARLLGDLTGAKALLERAEPEAVGSGAHEWFPGLAAVWRDELANPERARSLREHAVDLAEKCAPEEVAEEQWGELRTSILCDLAGQFRGLFNDDELVRAALSRAEKVAARTFDWLCLAHRYRDRGLAYERGHDLVHVWDPAGMRRCLEGAAAAAEGARGLACVAAEYRRWLGAEEIAAAVSPFGWAPRERPSVRELPGGLHGDPLPLLDTLRARITPEMLDIIAAADYGADWADHRKGLDELVGSGNVLPFLCGDPLEVLELTRWDPVKVGQVGGAFCCAVLVADAVGPLCSQSNGDACEDSLALLLESAWALELDDELELFLAWLARVHPGDYGSPVWPLLALTLCRARRDPLDSLLPELVERLEAMEGADWQP